MAKAPQSTEIAPLEECPAAFVPLGAKINELVQNANSTKAGNNLIFIAPLKSEQGESGPCFVEIDLDDLSEKLRANGGLPNGGSGGSGGGTVTDTEANAIDIVSGDGTLDCAIRSQYAPSTTYPTALKVVNGSTSVLLDSSGVTITNASSYTCSILFSLITHDMSVREISICDAGTVKKMLVLGSAAYT